MDTITRMFVKMREYQRGQTSAPAFGSVVTVLETKGSYSHRQRHRYGYLHATVRRCRQAQEPDGEMRLSAANELISLGLPRSLRLAVRAGGEDEHRYFLLAPLGRGQCAANAAIS